MILSIAWLNNSLAVIPFDSATAMSLASFCGSSGKVIVIPSFFCLLLGASVHNVPQKAIHLAIRPTSGEACEGMPRHGRWANHGLWTRGSLRA